MAFATSASVLSVSYDPRLIERAVVREVERRREAGDSKPFNEYHALQEGVHQFEPSYRGEAVEALHLRFFERFGFMALIPRLLAEDARLERRGLVTLADADEGAYLSPDRTVILLQLRPERFSDPSAESWLRLELAHLHDILDPEFGYQEDPIPGADGDLIRGRYAVLWSAACAARLVRERRAGASERDDAWLRFEACYRKLPPVERRAAFRALWERARWTHPELIDLARDPAAGARRSGGPTPGSLCPLCRFPTHAWVLPGPRLAAVAAEVARRWPAWRPEQGLCERCCDAVEMTAGAWAAR